MPDEIESQVRQVAADLFNTTPDNITMETSPQSIDTWDSVQHLNLVLALEQQFNIQFAPEEIESMTSIGPIIDLIRQKKSA